MIFDNQALFSKAQAITATAGSTNTVDFGLNGTVFGQSGAIPKDVGRGNEIPLLIQVVEDFNNLTSLKIDLELDTTETFTPDKTITIGTFLLAELIAGFQVPWKYLPQGVNMQFARLKYTVAGTAPTTGKITAGVVAAIQTSVV